jgi:hypothetical protein
MLLVKRWPVHDQSLWAFLTTTQTRERLRGFRGCRRGRLGLVCVMRFFASFFLMLAEAPSLGDSSSSSPRVLTMFARLRTPNLPCISCRTRLAFALFGFARITARATASRMRSNSASPVNKKTAETSVGVLIPPCCWPPSGRLLERCSPLPCTQGESGRLTPFRSVDSYGRHGWPSHRIQSNFWANWAPFAPARPIQ